LATAGLTPLFRRACVRAGLMDHPGQRKTHQEPVPLAGGFAMAGGAAIVLGVLWAWGRGHATPMTSWAAPNGLLDPRFVGLGAGAFSMALLGAWDDVRELPAGPKFLGQLLVASMIALFGLRAEWWPGHPVLNGVATVLWILT